jgi:AcrR family transcriptional regulator
MNISTVSKLSKGEQRRVAILDVAEQLFLSKGFSDVTLEMITSQAGGSRRVIYEHFGDKIGLFEAVCERIFRRVSKELEGIQEMDSGLRETLIRLGENILKVLTSNPTLPMFELVLSESRRFPIIGKMFYEEVPENAYMLLAAYLDQQIAQGMLRSVDTAMAARQFFGMIREGVHLKCILQPDYRPNDQEISDVVAGAVDLFLSALSVN